MLKHKKRTVLVGIVLAVLVAVGTTAYLKQRPAPQTGEDQGTPVQSHPTYKLELDSYEASDPRSIDLSFKIMDEKDQILKTFDAVHEEIVHMTAVRKDRNQIAYLEPDYDEASGTFSLSKAAFPSDGEYRLFAEFTPSNAQMGPDGTKLSATAYEDLTVGDVAKYQPVDVESERFKSSDNGFDINVFLAPHDPTDPGLAAGSTSSFAVSINKDGNPFTMIEEYKNSRGSIYLFGPDLDYVHSHTSNDEVPDTFVLAFSMTFPTSGKYKAFLQTQTQGQVNNTDYVLQVADEPTSEEAGTPPPGGMTGH